MKQIERIPYAGKLPESFFSIPSKIWAGSPFAPQESRLLVEKICAKEAETTELILYTDHKNIRLAGLFPDQTDHCYFGFWETVDDLPLNKAAFESLQADAIAKKKTAIIGPVNFNTFHSYRLRTGGPPSWGMFDREPVNPVYYPALLEQLYFTVSTTYESRLVPKESIPAIYTGKQSFLDEMNRIPYDFIPLHPATWVEYEDGIYGLIQAIFSRNPFYTAISREAFGLLYNSAFAEKLCPHSSVLFKEKKTGRLAAMSLCHPNYSALGLPEGMSPCFDKDFGKLEKKVLLAKSVGVHPDFRRQGLMNFLGAYAMLSFSAYYEEVIFCTMRSGNFSLSFTDGLAYEQAHYALYKKQLTH